MEFSTEAQKATYERVKQLMSELFGEQIVVEENAPIVGLRAGSAIVRVATLPWGDDDAVVNVFSWVVFDAEPTPELMSFLLHENRDMRFGAFGLDKDDDIVFEHTIVGSTLDKEELRASVYGVMSVSDSLDEEIVSRFGGRRPVDRKEE
ncbi:MAG: YbjN domain-containing protein [Coriobacteriia bacterium]|nr:YbjN domain-containing protein [Coriobacteriia bacterium]